MWMTKGRTILMQKSKKRARQQVIIDLLLACLWFEKLITGVIVEEIFGYKFVVTSRTKKVQDKI